MSAQVALAGEARFLQIVGEDFRLPTALKDVPTSTSDRTSRDNTDLCADLIGTLKAVWLLTPDDGTQRAYAVRRIVVEAIRQAAP